MGWVGVLVRWQLAHLLVVPPSFFPVCVRFSLDEKCAWGDQGVGKEEERHVLVVGWLVLGVVVDKRPEWLLGCCRRRRRRSRRREEVSDVKSCVRELLLCPFAPLPSPTHHHHATHQG